jgi:hypothetical protein
MARPRTAKPQPVEPEDESQELPEPEAGGTTISKAEAVRQALAQGNDSPEDGTDFLKRIYGIDMTRQMFSSYKAQEKARQAKKQVGSKPASNAPEQAKRGPKPKPAVEGYVAPPEKPRSAGEPDFLLALENIKELVGQYGSDRVKRMVDLLG